MDVVLLLKLICEMDHGAAASMVFRRGYVPVSEIPTNSTQQTGIAIIFLMTSLAFVTWSARMYSRFSKKQIGIDDWFVTVAMLFSIGLHVPYYYFFRYEYIGFHTKDLPKSYDIEPVLFYNWIMQVLYNPILALVKSSILFFLLRLGGHNRAIKWAIYGLNAFNVALMIAIFLTVVFQTIPINAYWDLSVKPERQIDGPVFYISSAIITIITDVLVLLIPFWIFLGLKMRIAAKLGLIVVFLMGGVVTIVAILRVIELHKKFYVKGYDSRHSLGDTLSSIEVNLAIIACCGPALRPLFRRMFPRLFSGKSTNDTGKYNTPSRYGNGTAGVSSFHLKDMHRSRTQTEIRGYSPNGSEEEIMTYNGILRTTAVDIKYGDAHSTDTEQVDKSLRGPTPP
ncbi:integral membrane protein PTH11 [Fusarium pseudocircinatum]|uniref:Integral membrane protein PTH11 n=1 Tax=Fusarium pseudocircinatum TaxID=56676 RepID=A0A8H5PU64_9HYPO|nr:integral membrane protein PTH11 [Fusarium pseudocircinatum]